MDVVVERGALQEHRADAIVVNLFRGVTEPGGATGAVDQALEGQVRRLIGGGDFEGRLAEVAVLYTAGRIPAERVILVGLGQQERFQADRARQAASAAARRAAALGVRQLASVAHGAGAGGLGPRQGAQATVEGSLLGTYRFAELKTDQDKPRELERLTLVEFSADQLPAVQEGAHWGQVAARAQNRARDVANRPGNLTTPTALAEWAGAMAGEHGLKLTVLETEDCRRLGMGAFAAVTQGSDQPAKFMVLEREGPGAPLVFVGKGVTFDSGGLSIKGRQDMDRMKFDMAGAAAVLAATDGLARAGWEGPLVTIVPATENLLSGRAYKPGDVLRSLRGKTIEVVSTDAEGRLILADALAYADRFAPRAVVDVATLTGGCMIALGRYAAGLFGNDERLLERVRTAAGETGERVWPLPSWEDYDSYLKSHYADLKNSGGKYASAVSAARFLAAFIGDYPWAHLDIPGVAWTDEETAYGPVGATGFGVRLLMELARGWEGQA